MNDAEDASLNAPRVVMSADFSENKAAIRIQSLFLRALAFRTMTERFTVVWQRGITLFTTLSMIILGLLYRRREETTSRASNKFTHAISS